MTTVDIGALLLAGSPTDESTPGWYFTDLGDWDDLSSSKVSIEERPQSNGAFGIATDWRTSLAFVIKGVFVGKSRVESQAAKRFIAYQLGQGGPVTVGVADVDGRLSRNASVRSYSPDDDHGQRTFTFTIDLVAFDAYKYGDTVTQTTAAPSSGGGLWWPLGTRRSDGVPDASVPYWDWGADGSSGRVSMSNPGNAESWPLLTATGGMAGGFTATDITTGQVVRFERLIPVGSQVAINMATGRAWIDDPSNDVSGYITGRDFFNVGPYETHLVQFAPLGAVTGTPQFGLSFTPAYL